MSSDKGMSAFFTLGILTNTEIIRDKQLDKCKLI